MTDCYLGIDVGSVTTKVALVAADERQSSGQDPRPRPWRLLGQACVPTSGQPLAAVQAALRAAAGERGAGDARVRAAGATGSGRALAGTVVGADVVKNEITAHALAALRYSPEAQTVLEIGGQDSKLIVLRHGVAVDFAMNTVCAAGTGSFLDRQASRLGLTPAQLGELALGAANPVRIAGRCAVFAESDMIHKQQVGHTVADVVGGLCQALVRNYLNNLAKGKEILPPVVFQGGVAANRGIVAAFEAALGVAVTVPPDHHIMGAIGAALLAQEAHQRGEVKRTGFRGFDVAERQLAAKGFECSSCPNACEVIELMIDGRMVARWGGRCGRWEQVA
jgi:predicted CoA-substrate-specific enzyme activase